MALNFPNSPTDGQVYTDTTTGNRYVYSLGSGRWNYTTNGVTMSVSSTAPGNPQPGNLWWNQDYGRLLVYYTDIDSSQWVDANPVVDFTASYSFSNSAANSANAFSNTKLANSTVTLAGTLTTTGSIIDSIGNVRDIPINAQTATYAISTFDAGEIVRANASIFVPNAVFSAGQTVMVYNNTAASITITPNSSVTMFLAGTSNTAVRNLSQRGLATIICVLANTFVISGAGLS